MTALLCTFCVESKGAADSRAQMRCACVFCCSGVSSGVSKVSVVRLFSESCWWFSSWALSTSQYFFWLGVSCEIRIVLNVRLAV